MARCCSDLRQNKACGTEKHEENSGKSYKRRKNKKGNDLILEGETQKEKRSLFSVQREAWCQNQLNGGSQFCVPLTFRTTCLMCTE